LQTDMGSWAAILWSVWGSVPPRTSQREVWAWGRSLTFDFSVRIEPGPIHEHLESFGIAQALIDGERLQRLPEPATRFRPFGWRSTSRGPPGRGRGRNRPEDALARQFDRVAVDDADQVALDGLRPRRGAG
jgi:hypothetical protein